MITTNEQALGDNAVEEAALHRYEGRTATPITVLALAFIVVYAIPLLLPDWPDKLLTTCNVLNIAIWIVFALDLLVRVVLAPHRGRYLATHPLDVATVVLPVLRPLRVLRVFTAGQALFTRGSHFSLLRAAQAVAASAGALVVISALAELDAERGQPGAKIVSFADALWWSATTVTTVGYGDMYPVTGAGRIVAVALMLVGISLIGVVTATVAAWFVTRTTETVEHETDTIEARLAGIEAQLAELTTLLQDRVESVVTDD